MIDDKRFIQAHGDTSNDFYGKENLKIVTQVKLDKISSPSRIYFLSQFTARAINGFGQRFVAEDGPGSSKVLVTTKGSPRVQWRQPNRGKTGLRKKTAETTVRMDNQLRMDN